MTWQLHAFTDNAQLCAALSDEIISVLQAGIEDKGKATLAVSGGSSPRPLFESLSTAPIDWSRVMLTLVDERWLAPDDHDANARLINECLRVGNASASQFLPLWNGAESAVVAEEATHEKLSALDWPLDAVILGMGADGHTASLFPGAATLRNALAGENSKGETSLCCALTPVQAPYERMSLTLPALLNCKKIFLQLRGVDKLRVFEQATKAGPVEELPIRAVLQQEMVELQVFSTTN